MKKRGRLSIDLRSMIHTMANSKATTMPTRRSLLLPMML